MSLSPKEVLLEILHGGMNGIIAGILGVAALWGTFLGVALFPAVMGAVAMIVIAIGISFMLFIAIKDEWDDD